MSSRCTECLLFFQPAQGRSVVVHVPNQGLKKNFMCHGCYERKTKAIRDRESETRKTESRSKN